MMLKNIPLLFALLTLTACDSSSRLNQENFDRIENGMPRKDVIALLGEPTDTSSLQLGGLSGTSAVWEDDTTRITIQFINDEVKVKQFTRSENEPVEP